MYRIKVCLAVFGFTWKDWACIFLLTESTSYPGLLGDCVAISPGKNRNRNFKNLVVFSANQLSLQKSCSRTQDITTRSLII